MTGDRVPLELVGKDEVRELRCVRLITNEGAEYVIRITDGMKPEEFKKRFDEIGISLYAKAIVSAPPDEWEWVQSLLDTFKYERKESFQSPPSGVAYGPSIIKVQVTSGYFRGIAKIAFHYFLTKVRDFRGDETFFSEIRDFIMNPCALEECRNFISHTDSLEMWGLKPWEKIKFPGHILSAEIDYTSLRARVLLFAGPQNRPLVYIVRLGSNPSRIDYAQRMIDYFKYFPIGARGGFDGEVIPMRSSR